MCLRTKGYKTREELRKNAKQIATKDIKVYKVLQQTNVSPYNYFLYEKGYHYMARISRRESKTFWEGHWKYTIEKGLHSCIDYNKAEQRKIEDCYRGKIVVMWIPKGSEYYISGTGDIVSNNLVWY